MTSLLEDVVMDAAATVNGLREPYAEGQIECRMQIGSANLKIGQTARLHDLRKERKKKYLK